MYDFGGWTFSHLPVEWIKNNFLFFCIIAHHGITWLLDEFLDD